MSIESITYAKNWRATTPWTVMSPSTFRMIIEYCENGNAADADDRVEIADAILNSSESFPGEGIGVVSKKLNSIIFQYKRSRSKGDIPDDLEAAMQALNSGKIRITNGAEARALRKARLLACTTTN